MKHGVVFCIALLLFSVPAVAQEESKFHFLVNGGLSLPQKPDIFKDLWKLGFNVGGGVGYRFTPHLTAQALVNYDRFPFDEAGFMDQFTEGIAFDPRDLGLSLEVGGATASVLSVSGELKASFVGDPDKVSPYVIGGAGVARLSAGDTTISLSGVDPILALEILGINFNRTIEGESETNAMATVGGGVDIPISERLGIFVEGRYQFNFTEEDRTDFASFRGGVKIGL